MKLLLKTGASHQTQITEFNDKVLRKGRNCLLICQPMREWQAHALKNTCASKGQAVRAF